MVRKLKFEIIIAQVARFFFDKRKQLLFWLKSYLFSLRCLIESKNLIYLQETEWICIF